MSAPEPSAELVAAVDEVFGFLPDALPADLMAIIRAPYSPNVLLAYAYRDGGAYLPDVEPGTH